MTKSQLKTLHSLTAEGWAKVYFRSIDEVNGRTPVNVTDSNGNQYTLYVGKRGKIYETEFGA